MNKQSALKAAQGQFRNFADFSRAMAGKVATGASLALVGVGSAMAAPADPGAAILSEITGAKGTVSGILIALAAVLGLFLLWSMIKRAK